MNKYLPMLVVLVLTGCMSNRPLVQSETELQDIMGGGGYPWVLVSIRFAQEPPQVVCMEEPELTYALMTEHDLQDEESMRNIISEGASSDFVFTKPEAWTNMPPPCAPASLHAMRKALQPISDDILLQHDFAETALELPLLVVTEGEDTQRAFAQVLIERGLRPYIGCSSGTLHIEKAKDWHNK
jgi:hypothetical protein